MPTEHIKVGLAVRFSCVPLFLLVTASSWLAYLTPYTKLLQHRAWAALPELPFPPNCPFRYNSGIWLVTQFHLVYFLPSWPLVWLFPLPYPNSTRGPAQGHIHFGLSQTSLPQLYNKPSLPDPVMPFLYLFIFFHPGPRDGTQVVRRSSKRSLQPHPLSHLSGLN